MHGHDQHRHDPRVVTPASVPRPPAAAPRPPAELGAPGASDVSPAADRTPSSGAPTGDAGVDAALTLLEPLDTLPVREHVRVFDDVHTALQARLADVGD